MKYDVSKAIEILSRTPEVLTVLLSGLSDDWLHGDEGPGTWSPFQVVGHLIINEETNFLPRATLIHSCNEVKRLQPIDMTAHISRFTGKKIDTLLSEFAVLRNNNIKHVSTFSLSDADMQKTATHPRLGTVNLSHVLSTWVAHDLTHLSQITRVMAKQYKEEIGPFIEFLTRLK